MWIWAAVLLVSTLRLWMANIVFFPLTSTFHKSSEFSAGRFAPGWAVLAINTSGEEVADTCFCAIGWVHERVFEMIGKEVCVVWFRLDRGGDGEVACMVGLGNDCGDAQGWC